MKRGVLFRFTSVVIFVVMIISITACTQTPATTATQNATTKATEGTTTETTNPMVIPGVPTGLDLTGTEPITLTVFGGSYESADSPAMETDVYKDIQKRTGVTFDFGDPNVADKMAKLNTMLASGDLPDIIDADPGVMYDTVISSKQVISFDDNDLVQTYGTNILKFTDFVDFERNKTSDHELYCAPTACNGVNPKTMKIENSWNVRWDLYEKLGYPEMEDMYDYLDVLKQMLDLEPVNKDGLKNYALGIPGGALFLIILSISSGDSAMIRLLIMI